MELTIENLHEKSEYIATCLLLPNVKIYQMLPDLGFSVVLYEKKSQELRLLVKVNPVTRVSNGMAGGADLIL